MEILVYLPRRSYLSPYRRTLQRLAALAFGSRKAKSEPLIELRAAVQRLNQCGALHTQNINDRVIISVASLPLHSGSAKMERFRFSSADTPGDQWQIISTDFAKLFSHTLCPTYCCLLKQPEYETGSTPSAWRMAYPVSFHIDTVQPATASIIGVSQHHLCVAATIQSAEPSQHVRHESGTICLLRCCGVAGSCEQSPPKNVELADTTFPSVQRRSGDEGGAVEPCRISHRTSLPSQYLAAKSMMAPIGDVS